MNGKTREFVTFAATGACAGAASIALLWALTELAGLHYLASYALTFLLVNAAAFFAGRAFAFRASTVAAPSGLARFYGISGLSVALNGVALAAAVEWLGAPYLAAAIVLVAANAPVNYLVHRRWTYRLARAG